MIVDRLTARLTSRRRMFAATASSVNQSIRGPSAARMSQVLQPSVYQFTGAGKWVFIAIRARANGSPNSMLDQETLGATDGCLSNKSMPASPVRATPRPHQR